MEKFNKSNCLTPVIDASVEATCKTLGTLSQLSTADKFYWHFISSCCKLIHVQPSTDDKTKLSIYLFVVDKLGKIFRQYCTTKKVNKSVTTCEVPEEIQLIPNVNVKDYFAWICKIHDDMHKWQVKFFDNDFNYDDIYIYNENLQIIVDIAKAVNADHLVFSATDIESVRDRYFVAYADLCSLLIKGKEEYGWYINFVIYSCYV